MAPAKKNEKRRRKSEFAFEKSFERVEKEKKNTNLDNICREQEKNHEPLFELVVAEREEKRRKRKTHNKCSIQILVNVLVASAHSAIFLTCRTPSMYFTTCHQNRPEEEVSFSIETRRVLRCGAS